MSNYEFSKRFTLDQLMNATNIAEMLSPDDCKYVGSCVKQGYEEDVTSRQKWEERTKRAMDLALQVMTPKTDPWINCSNVKLPLVTVAALQYVALAYPAIVDPPDLVKTMVYGEDPTGEKSARACRVAAHMSWQNIEQDEGWEECHDQGLLVQGIVGDAIFKKVYDPACRHNVTQLVLPENFVINYYTKDLDTSERYTHTYNLTDNDVRQRELDGRFIEPENGPLPKTPVKVEQGQLTQARDQRTGLTEPQLGAVTPYFTGEQYCWWDFDGDGYAEPYIVTFDIGTGFVRRIVARFLPSGVKTENGKRLNEENELGIPNAVSSGNRVYEITPVKVFSRTVFVPSPDGGWYSLGLGAFLGPINESANTAVNQLFDVGTMMALGGGFLGRGFKNRGGPFSFKPQEWYPIDAPGDDLHKQILPLPVREPSAVLFQLLGLLIQWGERIFNTNEIQAGENPGQNTPAETTRTLDANGRRMANAVFKRTWRGYRDEYRIQYDLNKTFITQSEDFVDLSSGNGAMIRPDDYQGRSLDVRPAADPYITSDAQRLAQSTEVLQASQQLPGFNRYQAQLRWLKARKVQGIAEIYPPLPVDPKTGKPMQDFPPPGPDPKMIQAQVAQGKLQLDMQEFQESVGRARVELMLEVQERGAKILNLQSQAILYQAQAKSEEMEPSIKLIYAQIEAESAARDRVLRLVDTLTTAKLEHRKLQLDAKKDGVNMPGIQSPADAVAQSNGQILGSLQ